MRRGQIWNLVGAGLAVLLGSVFSGGANAAEPPAPPAAAVTTVTGFRGANFATLEPAVRAAIAKDFPAQAGAVVRETNPVEQTTVLAITVEDLVPDSGPARITYILGYKSKGLIQVNVDWGAVDGQSTAVSVVNTARILGAYLKGAGYKPDTVVTDAALPDGSIMVFRGSDDKGHMTVLQLLGRSEKTEKGSNFLPKALHLAYIADPQHPDVFRLDKGKF